MKKELNKIEQPKPTVSEEAVKDMMDDEWSEKDEEMVEDLIEAIDTRYLVADYNEMVDWLKSLKNRVQPQSKQEWSQTDNELADDAIACVTRCYEEYKDNKEFYQSLHHNTLDIKRWLIDVRKGLTPHWKPSDEQIKALHDINLTGNISYAGQGQKLIELYQDLKKLRGK